VRPQGPAQRRDRQPAPVPEVFPKSESHTLSDLVRYTKVKGDTFHRASSDAASIIFVLEKGLQRPGRRPSFGALVRDSGGLLRFRRNGNGH